MGLPLGEGRGGGFYSVATYSPFLLERIISPDFTRMASEVYPSVDALVSSLRTSLPTARHCRRTLAMFESRSKLSTSLAGLLVTAACAAANIRELLLIISYLHKCWSIFWLNFSCILHILHVADSYSSARIIA